MSDSIALLALFEDIGPAADGIEELHKLGVSDGHMNVISGVPIPGRVLGRPSAVTHVSRIALAGAILCGLLGLALTYAIPYFDPLYVGGQPLYAIPPGWIVTFELTMLGLMLFAFLGLFVDSGFPSYTPKEYVPEISNGKIAVLFRCDQQDQKRIVDALTERGAESVKPAEARQL
jgi:hypothetical protein